VWLDKLALITLNTITSSIKALIKRFVSDFGKILALISAFHAFNIIEIFFFNIVLIEIAYMSNNFFVIGLAFLRSFINWRVIALASFSSYSLAFLRAFVTRLTLLSYLRFSSTSFFTSFYSWNNLAFTTCINE
jgi:hypothetical protein